MPDPPCISFLHNLHNADITYHFVRYDIIPYFCIHKLLVSLKMKYLLPAIILSLAVIGSMITYARSNNHEFTPTEPESTLNVIGYFSTNDTLIYWINQSNWQLTGSDTIKTSGISTKVRLTVADSTSTGYKMNYTFLELQCDSVEDSDYNRLLNRITENIYKKIIGTTIHFETDEFGTITKFNNIGQIKKQVKSLFRKAMKELLQLPEIASLKEYGLDIRAMTHKVKPDKLVEVYLEELNLLFLCHGLVYNLGKSHTHKDATETTYENDLYSTVELDTLDGTYSIKTEVINIIPRSAIKEMVGGLVEVMSNDYITESFNSGFDVQVDEDGIYNSYFSSDFFAHGWPYRIVKQTSMTIKGRGKSNQTYIYLDYINY